ncbi:protein of unknown function [Pricia antarctica]|uniref:Sulfatase N-terminal domain-containing protein n=1 Tax=Pricia antarctica TaxID=641691 RepID=A0A1G7F9Z4_9FLAO|nr:sulfatase-like hydrolase/transferase [Pricia antarctica]SDE72737.1 protein of unknown function [Pricia antarctica]
MWEVPFDATMVESMDDNMKKIVDYLNQNDLRENTMIVFTSDYGYHPIASENKLLRGAKGEIYEGGIKVPAMINWPGKIRARRTAAPISVLDYFPTLMDVAGIDYKAQLDGNSLTDLFQKDAESSSERPLFWPLASQYKHGTCSIIRKGNYKLIQFLADGKLELYDLKSDHSEAINLAEVKPKLTQQLTKELVEWRTENQIPLPPNS